MGKNSEDLGAKKGHDWTDNVKRVVYVVVKRETAKDMKRWSVEGGRKIKL